MFWEASSSVLLFFPLQCFRISVCLVSSGNLGPLVVRCSPCPCCGWCLVLVTMFCLMLLWKWNSYLVLVFSELWGSLI